MPLARLYKNIVQYHATQKPDYTSSLPVICVGNAVMGGSGKTPVVRALTEILQAAGKNPAILLRGYGGQEKGPLWVAQDKNFYQVGDEALIHAPLAPTMIAADRVAGAKAIEKIPGITHIVMDDGLQNPSLKKELSFLVVDGANPFGNGRIFPAGPLRETLDDAVRRVQAIILIGNDAHNLKTAYGFACPIFGAAIKTTNAAEFEGKPVIAFAGIGRPEKFFDSLRQADALVAETITFPDHYAYLPADIETLIQRAQKIGAKLVTTRKDWVRLLPEYRTKIEVLNIRLEWDDAFAVKSFLQQRGMI